MVNYNKLPFLVESDGQLYLKLVQKLELRGQQPTPLADQVKSQPALLENVTMHDYQLTGLQWLLRKHEQGLNVILGDEMGLGKTLQVIAFITALVAANQRQKKVEGGRFLVVAPLSVLPNWMEQFEQFAPSISTVMYIGPAKDREATQKTIDTSPPDQPLVVVTSYEMLLFDHDFFHKIVWEVAVMDEGHRLKNPKGQLHGIVSTRLRSKHMVVLTGTPIQNDLQELFALLSILNPSIFNDQKLFEATFRDYFSAKAQRLDEDRHMNSRKQFLCANTVEESIYRRTLKKIRMADRIRNLARRTDDNDSEPDEDSSKTLLDMIQFGLHRLMQEAASEDEDALMKPLEEEYIQHILARKSVDQAKEMASPIGNEMPMLKNDKLLESGGDFQEENMYYFEGEDYTKTLSVKEQDAELLQKLCQSAAASTTRKTKVSRKKYEQDDEEEEDEDEEQAILNEAEQARKREERRQKALEKKFVQWKANNYTSAVIGAKRRGGNGASTVRQGKSSTFRLNALETALQALAYRALELDATVHLPRIGYGTPNFNWYAVERLLARNLRDVGFREERYDS
eukprot:jgi/Phyca11/13664/fgenesh1_pg.PHYCAscaffold_4_\